MQLDYDLNQKQEKILTSSASQSTDQVIQNLKILAHRVPLAVHEDATLSADVYEIDGEKELYLHLDLRRWSKDNAKKMMAVIAKVSEDLKSKGVNDLYVLIPAGDEKLLKFEQMMGFYIYQEVYDPLTNEVKYFKMRYRDGS